MILKKMAAAVAEQNWFTAFLEILIVIVGILIGLQVDDWNEARKDRNREIEYLQRIDSELAEDISAFDSGINLADQRTEYAKFVLAALDDPTSVTRDPTGFVRALVRAGFTYSPIVSDHTFEELKSAGELGIIEDVVLRVSITKYYQQVRQYSQWNYLREMNQTEYLKRQTGILTPTQFEAFWVSRNGKEVPPDEASAAFDRLVGTPELTEWLPITIAFLGQGKIVHQEAKKNAENLREEITAFLEKNSADWNSSQ